MARASSVDGIGKKNNSRSKGRGGRKPRAKEPEKCGQAPAEPEAKEPESAAEKDELKVLGREEEEEKPWKGARKALRHAAMEVMKRRCKQFVDKLIDRAVDDIHIAELVLSLMEKKGGSEKDKSEVEEMTLEELLLLDPKMSTDTKAKADEADEEFEEGDEDDAAA